MLSHFEIAFKAITFDPDDTRKWKAVAAWRAGGGRVIIAASPVSSADNRSRAGFLQTLVAKVDVPVLVVPRAGPSPERSLASVRSLLRRGQSPFAVLAIGESGARNAALAAVSILALTRPALRCKLVNYRDNLAAVVRKAVLLESLNTSCD